MAPQLRDYQIRLREDLGAALRAGARAPLAVLPTGGGKTSVIADMCRRIAATGGRVYVMAHRREIVEQIRDRLLLFGVIPGVVAPWAAPELHAPVQAASVQTLARRIDQMPEPGWLLFDEAHHSPAGEWSAIAEYWPAARRVGFTATPVRGDGRGLSLSFDQLVLGPSARELADRGFLVDPEIWCPSVPDLAGVKLRGGDWDAGDLEKALSRSAVVGDAATSFCARIPTGMPSVLFCASIAHATVVANALTQAGRPCAVLSGEAKPDHRKQLLSDLRDGTVDALAVVDVVSEGFDMPQIGAAVMLRPTRSLGLFLQQAGRVLRPCDGKDRAILLDHAGNVLRHGHPLDDREWSLVGGETGKERKTTEEGDRISIRQCPECYAVNLADDDACPRCGHVHEPDNRIPAERAGELRRLEAAELKRIAEEKARARRREEGQAQSLASLLELERQRGYRPGWARARYTARMRRAS